MSGEHIEEKEVAPQCLHQSYHDMDTEFDPHNQAKIKRGRLMGTCILVTTKFIIFPSEKETMAPQSNLM